MLRGILLRGEGRQKRLNMAARVLHFGPDNCNRLLVLRSDGYSVDPCFSLREFRSLLEQGADLKAVLVAAPPDMERRQVVTLTREKSHAGLVLFDSSCSGVAEREFDLVIPPLMRPEDWLRQIAGLIEKSRVLIATATAVREQSARLRKDSGVARRKSMIERERSATERAKAKEAIDHTSQKPDLFDK
ncbi:hypothetical protein [Alloacidobacterium sp.]|uniref:hypothetical protein n=1 Tax=Alloacidobacterium sp. TaxID=2951999 RepID=UPI002D71F4CF|nr:hypothetical protein [Alloacidobacterium sp.]HYK37422.1 hypothetical protein [Alloacidobacterium sp.]